MTSSGTVDEVVGVAARPAAEHLQDVRLVASGQRCLQRLDVAVVVKGLELDRRIRVLGHVGVAELLIGLVEGLVRRASTP